MSMNIIIKINYNFNIYFIKIIILFIVITSILVIY